MIEPGTKILPVRLDYIRRTEKTGHYRLKNEAAGRGIKISVSILVKPYQE